MPFDCGPNVEYTLWSHSLDDTDLCGDCNNQFVYTDFGKAITILALYIYNRSSLALWNKSGKQQIYALDMRLYFFSFENRSMN